jgi:hypothetical protein
MKQRMVCVLAVTAAMISPARAQQYVYPAKGQSAQQQAAFGKARAACLEGKGYTVK